MRCCGADPRRDETFFHKVKRARRPRAHSIPPRKSRKTTAAAPEVLSQLGNSGDPLMVVSSGEEDLEDCNIFDAQDDDDQIPPEGLEESHANEDVGSVPSADGESQLDAGNAGKPESVPVPFFEPRCRTDGIVRSVKSCYRCCSKSCGSLRGVLEFLESKFVRLLTVA